MPPNLPMRVSQDLASPVKDRPRWVLAALPVPPQAEGSPGPGRRDMPPATHPPLPNKKLPVPEPALPLDGRLSEPVKGIRTPLTSVCPRPFKLRGDEGRGGRGDLNGGPGDRQKEAPPEIKGPGRNRGSGAALSPMAALPSPAPPPPALGLPGREAPPQALSPSPSWIPEAHPTALSTKALSSAQLRDGSCPCTEPFSASL